MSQSAVNIIHGDSRDVLRGYASDSFDSCVTDPPYALVSITKRFGKSAIGDDTKTSERSRNRADGYARAASGFMGQKWDTGETAFDPVFWREVLRVMKPGAHLVAFSGTRTYHRIACAIEDAGFEVRDMLSWLYGSGFPKSHDVSKGIDRTLGRERTQVRVDAPKNPPNLVGGVDKGGDRPWRTVAAAQGFHEAVSDEAVEWQGWGTALKPSFEPLVFAQKPFPFKHNIATIGSTIRTLWSRIWLMLPANLAAQYSALNPAACDVDPSDFAQWNAESASNTRDALSAQMDTLQFELAMISSLNTVSSWSAIWEGACAPENTSIIATELSTIIDSKTLTFLASKITPASIILAHKSGQWQSASASNAERVFSAAVRKLSGTLELSALANAIDSEAESCRDAGASPNCEPIVLARKPLIGTVAANVLEHGTGAINIDACRIDYASENDKAAAAAAAAAAEQRSRQVAGRSYEGWGMEQQKLTAADYAAGPAGKGRWPANIITDGSEEVLAGFPDTDGARVPVGPHNGTKDSVNVYGDYGPRERFEPRGDSGSAARYFYTAKADSDDRLGSSHPTVKPVDLMQWLVRLVTRKGGLVLDPFAGTGTTGEACIREGMRAVLIEREERFVADIHRRMALAMCGPDERARESIKEKIKQGRLKDDPGPLFTESAA